MTGPDPLAYPGSADYFLACALDAARAALYSSDLKRRKFSCP
jgi:hypothetical protein